MKARFSALLIVLRNSVGKKVPPRIEIGYTYVFCIWWLLVVGVLCFLGKDTL
jgi:hypothetical protein